MPTALDPVRGMRVRLTGTRLLPVLYKWSAYLGVLRPSRTRHLLVQSEPSQ